MASSDEYQQIQFWEGLKKEKTWMQKQEEAFIEQNKKDVEKLFCITHKEKTNESIKLLPRD